MANATRTNAIKPMPSTHILARQMALGIMFPKLMTIAQMPFVGRH